MTSIFILCLIHVINKKDVLTEAPVLISLIIMAIISLLFILIFGLTGFHMVLVSRGRTTNEQVTGKFRGGYNPFSKNCCYNCCYTLCGPQYPSLKHPAKYVGRKPRKYTVPVPVVGSGEAAASLTGNVASSSLAARASGRGRPQGVDPLAAQAAAATQVRTYRDNGVKHSNSSYNRMSAASNQEGGEGSDMDEPMASQGQDSEAPQHNGRDESGRRIEDPQRTPLGYAVSQSAASPYSGQGRLLQGGGTHYQHGSPHVPLKPAKRSATPEHMLNDQGGVEMRQLGPHSRTAHSPQVSANKVRSMGGVATPLAGQMLPTVSSPGRQYGGQYPSSAGHFPPQSGPTYSQAGARYAPSTAYNPGYQEPPPTNPRPHPGPPAPGRRYLSEGELLEPGQGGPLPGLPIPQGVGTSTSAGHIQDLAGSPKGSFYMWKTEGGNGGGQHYYQPQHGSDPASPVHPHGPSQHSYAQQVGYFLQQPVTEYVGPSLQSGGPRTTPSGYPGGPVVPPGQVSPKGGPRRGGGGPHFPHGPVGGPGYSEQATVRTCMGNSQSPPQGPMTFTRALEVTDRAEAGEQSRQLLRHSNGQVPRTSEQEQGENRESVYDMNYEISV